MNFICKELTINDDREFGCTIEFSDSIDNGSGENQEADNYLNVNNKYFLVQRSYPEDFDENDDYYVETTESYIELSYKDKLYFELNTNRIKIRMAYEVIEIGLNLSKEEYKSLKKAIKQKFNDFIILLED